MQHWIDRSGIAHRPMPFNGPATRRRGLMRALPAIAMERRVPVLSRELGARREQLPRASSSDFLHIDKGHCAQQAGTPYGLLRGGPPSPERREALAQAAISVSCLSGTSPSHVVRRNRATRLAILRAALARSCRPSLPIRSVDPTTLQAQGPTWCKAAAERGSFGAEARASVGPAPRLRRSSTCTDCACS